jgi:predicted DsbA family dithiol-disulfide isomerase
MGGSRMKDLIVDLFADPTCPWCFVGWKSLQMAAAQRPDVDVHVIWRPYLLRTDAPAEGVDRKAFFAARMQEDPERWTAVRAALLTAAAEVGAEMKPDGPDRIPNAINAQRLMIWALGQDKLAPVAEALFKAYWTQGRDIGAADVLVDVAREGGLDPEIVAELLASDADRDAVLAHHASAHEMGIAGVPAMVFNRRVARVGAETPATYLKAIDVALAEPA